MAASRPTTLEAFGRIPGVGKAKLEAYGAAFVDAICTYRMRTGWRLRRARSKGRRGGRTGIARRRTTARGSCWRGGGAWRRSRGSVGSLRRPCWGTSSTWRTGARRWRSGTCSRRPERMGRIEEAIAVAGARSCGRCGSTSGRSSATTRSHRAGVPSRAGAAGGGVAGGTATAVSAALRQAQGERGGVTYARETVSFWCRPCKHSTSGIY